jgi:HPr kinase/phosphorylase
MPLSVETLYANKRESLKLEYLNPDVDLDRPIGDPDVSGPGLALAGYLDRFPAERVQVFGQTEMSYLASLPSEEAALRVRQIFTRGIPAAVISKGIDVPDYFIHEATSAGVPVFRSELMTRDVFQSLAPFVEQSLAPSTTVHGSLADVHGIGLLFTGDSGIGKSECVLDLVERGHRVVADDVVIITRRSGDVLIGRGHELQRHHMEIRGVGIVDVQRLFGVQAIRQQKRIEVVVRLVPWGDEAPYDRTGLEQRSTEILGVKLPEVVLPLNPGKNITVISEVVALNHLLRLTGHDSGREFNRTIRDAMESALGYLAADYE